MKEVAPDYGVKYTTAKAIKNGYNWKHVTERVDETQ
jgi:hypothetical protein